MMKNISLSEKTSKSDKDRYYAKDKSTTSDDVRLKKVRKYEPKVLMYVAMLKDDLSKPYIHESKGSIDSQVYINKCLRPTLVPIIRERDIMMTITHFGLIWLAVITRLKPSNF